MVHTSTSPLVRAQTSEFDVDAAVAALARDLPSRAACTIVFASPIYDLERLGSRLRDTFGHPVVGCTAAGCIGPLSYGGRGLAAVSFDAASFEATPLLVEPLSSSDAAMAGVVERAREVTSALEPGERVFGVLLVDGLSGCEERITAELFLQMSPFAILGGSAGDDLYFEATHVLENGTFGSDRAVLVLFKTRRAFRPFRIQHHVAGDELLVVTRADAARRRVLELNGRPAAEAYASAIGAKLDELTPEVFSTHAVAVRMGGQEFLRSIQCAHPDGSLDFYCAIDRGVPLRVTDPVAPVAAIRERLDELRGELGPSLSMLCFDCILRQIEFTHLGLTDEVAALLDGAGAVGFHTYGEQFNALHVNQTLVGIAFDEEEAR